MKDVLEGHGELGSTLVSLRLPAYFPRATEDERILEAEPGEILLLPAEGRIFRTAGIYGVWEVFDDELFSLYNPETSTTTTGFETTTSSPPISTIDSTISTSSTTTGIIPSINKTTTPDIEQGLDIWILSISVIAIASEIIAFLFIIRRRDAGAKAT